MSYLEQLVAVLTDVLVSSVVTSYGLRMGMWKKNDGENVSAVTSDLNGTMGACWETEDRTRADKHFCVRRS